MIDVPGRTQVWVGKRTEPVTIGSVPIGKMPIGKNPRVTPMDEHGTRNTAFPAEQYVVVPLPPVTVVLAQLADVVTWNSKLLTADELGTATVPPVVPAGLVVACDTTWPPMKIV